MRITPLDIIQKQDRFTSIRRGLDPDEVRTFLEQVRDTLEDVLAENQQLRGTVAARDEEIATLRGAEANIKDTLLLARRLSEDLERRARREADLIVGEARLEAQQILKSAADERRSIQSELVHLHASRVRMIADLRAVVESHMRLLEHHDAKHHQDESREDESGKDGVVEDGSGEDGVVEDAVSMKAQ
ncbi:MAG: DivIVA domain-containing protein [Myxococcota bacterium]